MEEENKFIIISSYDDEVRYFKNVMDGKEHRAPIFTGAGESGKSTLYQMMKNGDIEEEKVKSFIAKL